MENKKILKTRTIDVDISCIPVEEVIAKLEKYKWIWAELCIFWDQYWHYECYIEYKEEETDEEFKQRVKEDELFDKIRKLEEKKEYERLKELYWHK